jgi:hypothetical protein
MFAFRMLYRFATWLLLASLAVACAPPQSLPAATAIPLADVQRSCDDLFGFLEWGLVPGSTTKAEVDALLEARLGEAYTRQRSAVVENREKVSFVVGDAAEEENPHAYYDLFFRDGVLQRVFALWRGLPRPQARTMRECLGEPELYDAAFLPDLQMRYDVVFWYPERGLRVESTNYVRSNAKPNLGDGQVFAFATWVAPGSPSFMVISSFL